MCKIIRRHWQGMNDNGKFSYRNKDPNILSYARKLAHAPIASDAKLSLIQFRTLKIVPD